MKDSILEKNNTLDWTSHKESIEAIIELVEDPVYPARRNILDYVQSIFDYDKELEEFVEDKLIQIIREKNNR